MDFSRSELSDMLAAAVGRGDIDENSPAHGIALKVLAEGTEKNLTPMQAKVYDTHVRPFMVAAARAAEVADRRARWPD